MQVSLSKQEQLLIITQRKIVDTQCFCVDKIIFAIFEKRTTMKKTIFAILFLILSFSDNYAQNNYEAFKDSINKKLELLSHYPQTLYEDDWADFDPDSLSSVVATDITKYLKSEGFTNFKIEDFPLIEHVETENNQFETLVVGYHCGGSAGWIPHSIIIKHTKDKPLIYNIEAETHFYEFHQLKNELYLCIGASPGSGICRGYSVFAIDFSKDTAQFKPVFNGEYAFYLCNSDITFEEEENILSIYIDFLPYKDEDETYETYLKEHNYTYFSVEYDSQKDEQNPVVVFKSKFDGEKFVTPNN